MRSVLLVVAAAMLCINITSRAQKTEIVYLDVRDTSVSKYLIIRPDAADVNEVLVLVPGFGENAQDVLLQTSLPAVAAERGFLIVIPTFRTGLTSFGIDSISQHSLDTILLDVYKRNHLSQPHLLLCGFSIGGSCVIKYAERCNSSNGILPKPAAVFAIDPPLDFERFYYACQRKIRLSQDNRTNTEAAYFLKRIPAETGGTPSQARENYQRMSPFSASDSSQQAVKALYMVPVMIFCEPDISWWMQNRSQDLYDMNVLDCAAMINELKQMSSANAVLALTSGKGYREPGHIRHPHSWSIAAPIDILDWMMRPPHRK